MTAAPFDIKSVLTAVAVLLMGIYLIARQYKRESGGTERRYRTPEEREAELTTKVEKLEAIVDTLLSKYAEAQKEIETLRGQLSTANARIRELESIVEAQSSNRRIAPQMRLLKPLLVICGDDPQVAGVELETLDGIGIRYTRLYDAAEEDVVNEIARVREDGRLYKWALVAGHCSAKGVRLKGQWVAPDFWMRQLSGVCVVCLASCETTTIADHLVNRVDFVCYFREQVLLEPANRFIQKFFQRLQAGDEAEAAFISCLDAVPEVASYADYRIRRR